MTPDDSKSLHSMRRLAWTAWLAVIVAMWVVTSCQDEKHPLLSGSIDPERFPTMRTTNVSTLISDSGITRYKITSPLWLMFEDARTPQWRFPNGLHLEKYDNFFRKDATVDADSATYFKNSQTWRLDGYVRIANMAGEKFLTNQLFWDQKHRKIYSDSFIHIEKSDRIIEGYGFESNEQMTHYKVRNVAGIFPVENFKGGRETDSTRTDSVVVAPPPSTPRPRQGDDSTRHSVNRPTRPTSAPAVATQPAQQQKATAVTTIRRTTAPAAAPKAPPLRPGSRPSPQPVKK